MSSVCVTVEGGRFLLTIFRSSDDDGQFRVEADTRDILGMALQSLNAGLVLLHTEKDKIF